MTTRFCRGLEQTWGALTHSCNNSAQTWALCAWSLPLGRIGQDGANMLAREAREIFEDLIFVQPTGEILEDIRRGDTGSEKRRLPAAHAGGDLNQIPPIHGNRDCNFFFDIDLQLDVEMNSCNSCAEQLLKSQLPASDAGSTIGLSNLTSVVRSMSSTGTC